MLSRRAAFNCFVALLLLFSASFASNVDELKPDADALVGSIFAGPSMATLGELTDTVGGRLTGSPAYNKAADWAMEKFRSYGLKNVHVEPFTLPNGWLRGTASGRLVAPVSRQLHLESLGWSPSTSSQGIEGQIVVVSSLDSQELRSHASQFKGKIIFLDTHKIFERGFMKVIPLIKPAWKIWVDAKALGLLFPDHENNNVLNAHAFSWGGELIPLPGAEIGMEDAELLQRLSERGPVTVQFTLNNQTSGPVQVPNVIAELPGGEKSKEWILVGAHLDSWDFGTGAQDNGSGTASVLETARALSKLGKTTRRTIRFALWGGEEQGLVGSYAYTKAHADDLAHCIAVLNTDNGAGTPKGWKVEGRPDVGDAISPISSALLKELNGDAISLETSFDTDHGPFLLYGIPTLDLWVDMKPYMLVHHKPSDTLDKVDPLSFKAGTAILTVTAYAIAQDTKPVASQIDHAAVAAIIQKADLQDMLTALDLWKP